MNKKYNTPKDQVREEKHRHWLRQRSLRDSYKTSCSKCGYSEDKSILCFHHTNPETKLYKVSDAVIRSKKQLLEEISKCVVLCVKCHDDLHQAGRPLAA